MVLALYAVTNVEDHPSSEIYYLFSIVAATLHRKPGDHLHHRAQGYVTPW